MRVLFLAGLLAALTASIAAAAADGYFPVDQGGTANIPGQPASGELAKARVERDAEAKAKEEAQDRTKRYKTLAEYWRDVAAGKRGKLAKLLRDAERDRIQIRPERPSAKPGSQDYREWALQYVAHYEKARAMQWDLFTTHAQRLKSLEDKVTELRRDHDQLRKVFDGHVREQTDETAVLNMLGGITLLLILIALVVAAVRR